MKTLLLLCLILSVAVGAQAQVSGGISVNDDGVKSFYLAIGQTYHVPERDVMVVHERQIPDDEIPVVFFIAKRAHVRPEAVIGLRLSGQSWMDITLHYRLKPSIYYVSLNGDPGPEYGRVYGQWRQPRRSWSRMRLDDDDIVKMVNLQFVSKHYGVKTDEVARLRGQHGNFVGVTNEVSRPDYRSNRDKNQRQNNARGNDNGRSDGNNNSNNQGNGEKVDHH